MKPISFRSKRSLLVLVFSAAALLAGCASMSGTSPASVSDGVLTGPKGMTLYTFDKDMAGSGKSACNGKCAANWPPMVADEMAQASGDYSIIRRDDGSKQWVFKGKPLYYWIKDSKPGDRTGDGFNKVWQLARP